MAGDGAEEGVALERVQLRLLARPRGRGAGDVAQERNFAEVVAGPEYVRLPAVDLDLDLSGIDDVEAVAVVPLSKDGLAGGDPHPRQARSERLERWRRQRREH